MSVKLNSNDFVCFKFDDKTIAAKYSFNKNEYEFYLESTKHIRLSQKISEVGYSGGINAQLLGQFSPIKFRQFVELTYPQLTTLSDGSFRLCIYFRIYGGMLSNFRGSQHISDIELTNAIIQALPEDTYRSINVTTARYSFGGFLEKDTRIITLDPHDYAIERFLCSILTFFRGYKPTRTMNGTLMQMYLFGELDNNETEKLRAERDILDAFNQKRSMYIYISKDWENIEVKFGDAPQRGCLIQ